MEGCISKGVGVMACTGMAISYVGILYAPTVILRLPPPRSLNNFIIRRFLCVIISSIASLFLSAFLLPIGSLREVSTIFDIYGVRVDHMWHAVVFPLLLTSLLYTGSLLSKTLLLLNAWNEVKSEPYSCQYITIAAQRFRDWIHSIASNVLAWRNYVVAPLTEELVFRACMIPLLLCGGFKIYSIIFLSPIFFSLAHLHHFLELYFQQNCSFLKASLLVGLQLGYTVIFGWYASFLFIRTGHLSAPIVAHIFCNVMGLPVLSSSQRIGATSIAFLAGLVGFLCLLFPATNPNIYNERTDNCKHWHGYCSWN